MQKFYREPPKMVTCICNTVGKGEGDASCKLCKGEGFITLARKRIALKQQRRTEFHIRMRALA